MKKVIDFTEKKIERARRYKEVKIQLDLEKDLDLLFSVFGNKLKQEITEQLDSQDLDSYDGDVFFQIYTGLPREELIPLRNLILSKITEYLIVSKDIYKGKEKILGTYMFDDFDRIEMPLVDLMDLVNYPLKKERFNIQLYDDKNLLYKSLVNW